MVSGLFVISEIIVGIYFLSPAILFIKFFQKSFSKWYNLPIAQMLMILFNCVFWVIGELKSDNKLEDLLIYSIGLLFSLIFIFIYWFVAYRGNFQNYFLFVFTGFNIVFEIAFGISRINEKCSVNISIIFNIIMYMSLYQNIYFSIKTHEKNILPIYESIIGITSATLWLTLGIIEKHPKRIIPNAISLVFLIIGLGVSIHIILNKNEPIDLKIDNDSNNGDVSLLKKEEKLLENK